MNLSWVILHGGALGDLALTLHFALRLPDVDSDATLTVVSRTDPGDLSRCRPGIVRESPENLRLHWLYGDGDDPPARLASLMRGRRVLNALGDAGSRPHAQLAKLSPHQLLSLDPRPDPATDVHIVAQWRRRLATRGVELRDGEHAGLVSPDELRCRGAQLLRDAGVETTFPPIVIHPGSGGRHKCWPLAAFVDVARRLCKAGTAACFLIGPAELDRWPARTLGQLAREFPVLRCDCPDKLTAILAAAACLVGNDAGPAHLAALLGTPTVTVFGATSPTVWRPLGDAAEVLAADACHPNGRWGIDPAAVASCVDQVTARAAARRAL